MVIFAVIRETYEKLIYLSSHHLPFKFCFCFKNIHLEVKFAGIKTCSLLKLFVFLCFWHFHHLWLKWSNAYTLKSYFLTKTNQSVHVRWPIVFTSQGYRQTSNGTLLYVMWWRHSSWHKECWWCVFLSDSILKLSNSVWIINLFGENMPCIQRCGAIVKKHYTIHSQNTRNRCVRNSSFCYISINICILHK